MKKLLTIILVMGTLFSLQSIAMEESPDASIRFNIERLLTLNPTRDINTQQYDNVLKEYNTLIETIVRKKQEGYLPDINPGTIKQLNEKRAIIKNEADKIKALREQELKQKKEANIPLQTLINTLNANPTQQNIFDDIQRKKNRIVSSVEFYKNWTPHRILTSKALTTLKEILADITVAEKNNFLLDITPEDKKTIKKLVKKTTKLQQQLPQTKKTSSGIFLIKRPTQKSMQLLIDELYSNPTKNTEKEIKNREKYLTDQVTYYKNIKLGGADTAFPDLAISINKLLDEINFAQAYDYLTDITSKDIQELTRVRDTAQQEQDALRKIFEK